MPMVARGCRIGESSVPAIVIGPGACSLTSTRMAFSGGAGPACGADCGVGSGFASSRVSRIVRPMLAT